MAASSLLVTSLAGSTTLHDKTLSCAMSSLPRRMDSSKLGFISCQAFGNGTLSAGRSKGVRMSKQGHSVGVARCEASDENSNSLDIWIGRAAMLGFVGVVAVEVATGKGVLESAGLVAPLPTLALALTAVVGAVTAFGIFRSVNNEN